MVNLTNAKELYAVDYLRTGQTVGSILILKTEKGVYEHTKYICDRLLGAQLVSVSTIEIQNQQFIKALIRNSDGSLEFVLSLSAKLTNNDSKFEVESHWNLDKYQKDANYYNFQIWTSSLDDLVKLAEEVIRLLEVQKPIEAYNLSAPPTVYVRQGRYQKGKLDLEIVNTNSSETVTFNAGVRATETQKVENISTQIDLEGAYISNIEVDAGNLFDTGFRIGDGVQTPDDLFLSDGPWGYDDSNANIKRFEIAANKLAYTANEFTIERNVILEAETDNYVSTYRALAPRFLPVDVSEYNSIKLKAKGTGALVRLIKSGVDKWENQYTMRINLNIGLQIIPCIFLSLLQQQGALLKPMI